MFITGYYWIYGLVNLHYALSNILPAVLFLLWILLRVFCIQISNTETMNLIYGKIKDDIYNTCDDEMRPSGIIVQDRRVRIGGYLATLFTSRYMTVVYMFIRHTGI